METSVRAFLMINEESYLLKHIVYVNENKMSFIRWVSSDVFPDVIRDPPNTLVVI